MGNIPIRIYGNPDSKKALALFIGHGCQPFLLSGQYPKKHPIMFKALLTGWELHCKGKTLSRKQINRDYRCLAGALGRGIKMAELLALSKEKVTDMLESKKLEKDFLRTKEII